MQLHDASFRYSDVAHLDPMTIPEHSHDRASLNLVISGDYPEHCKDLRRRAFPPGHLIYKPPGQPHANQLTVPVRSLVIELSHNTFETLCSHDDRFNKPWQAFDPTSSRLAQQLCYRLRVDDDQDVSCSLAFELLDHACDRSPQRNPTWLGKVIDLIMSDYARSPSIDELSTFAGISPTHFARAFKQATGHTAGEFIRARRVSAALALLAEDQHSGAEVAAEVGFSDESHMIRTVRKALRTSPAGFRRSVR